MRDELELQKKLRSEREYGKKRKRRKYIKERIFGWERFIKIRERLNLDIKQIQV